MMWNWNGMMNWGGYNGGFGFIGLLFMTILLIDAILFGIWLWKQIQKK